MLQQMFYDLNQGNGRKGSEKGLKGHIPRKMQHTGNRNWGRIGEIRGTNLIKHVL